MKKYILTFLGLFIFIMIIIPQNVFADSSGNYLITKVDKLYFNIDDLTDTYEVNNTTLNKITNTSNYFYNYYRFYTGNILQQVDSNTNTSKYYSPHRFNLYNGSNAIDLCTEQCDQMFSFSYYFQAVVSNASNYETEYAIATNYLNRAREVSTSFGGIKIVGTDVNDEPKEFFCTSQYIINSLGSTDPYMKFFVTCPTSNFKHVDYISLFTGWPAIDNTTYISIGFYIDRFFYTNSAYTGTQDGSGGTGIGGGEGTTEDIYDSITDDNIDSNFQNSTMNDINSQMASNNVISDLLLLPVRMYQSILNSLGNNSCVAYNLGSLYGTNLQLPCIQVQNYIGNELWTTIDLIFCGMFILVIRKKFVDIFNNMTNLKNGGNEIE